MDSVNTFGVIAVKKIIPRRRPTIAGGVIIFRMRQLALRINLRIPTKSIAIKSGNRIAKASLILDWLAIKGSDRIPRPAPKPLFDTPTMITLITAHTKNMNECA